MLVVVGIFSTATLILTNLYVTVTKAQRRVASIQRVLEDARFAVETIGQQVRLGSVDYSYYSANGIDLYPSAPTKPDLLALRTQTNEQLFFRLQANVLQTCTFNASSDCMSTGWQDITPANVKVTYLAFQIWPSADPFASYAGPSACASDLDCTSSFNKSYRCNLSATPSPRCEYATDGRNFQPKVRVTMRSEGTGAIAERSRVHIETLLTTRSPKGKVENPNYADTP